MKEAQAPVRIIYLDDSPLDTQLIARIIEDARDEIPTVLECVSTKEDFIAALEICPFDLVLSDYRMPGYDGDQALRDAKARCPDVPFIMVTGELGEERAIETLKRGATDYVLKDSLGRLVPSIQRALKEAAAERERRDIAQSLVEAQHIAHVGNWQWNMQSGELRWSAEIFAIFGVDPSLFIPTIPAFSRYIHPDDREFVNRMIQRAVSMAGPVNFDFRIIVADGSVRFLHTAAEVKEFDTHKKPRLIVGITADISERKRIEDALRESEQRYRMLHETLRDPFVQVDMEGRIMECNDLFCAMLGYSPEEVISLTYQEITPERWHAIEERILREQIISRGYSDVYEKEYIRKDGTVIPVELREILYRNDDGRPTAIWAVVRDISERKITERALQVSEERLKTVLANSRDIIFCKNVQTGKFEFVSSSTKEILGYSAEEVVMMDNETAASLIHPDDRWATRAALAKLEETGVAQAEYRQRARSGEYRWLSSHVAEIRDNDGQPLYMIGTIRDITERKEAELKLAESEKAYRDLFEKMTEGFLLIEPVFDEAGQAVSYRYLDANPALERLTHLTRSEIVGKTAHELLEAVEPHWVECFARVAQSGESESFEEYSQALSGWYNSYVYCPEPGKAAVIYANITERKHAEAALRQSQQRLKDLILHAPTFIYEINFRERRFTEVNDAMCVFSGYSREEMLAKDPMDFLVDESKARFKERMARWLRGEAPEENVEYHVKVKNGDDRWVILKVTFIGDESGQPLGATVIGHDITERRRMEEALRESEEKFRVLTEASPAAVLVYREGKHLYVNRAAEEIFGYSKEELLAIDFLNLIHPEYRDTVRNLALARANGERKLARYEVRIVTKDGKEKWIDVSSTLIPYGEEPAGIVSCIDVTEKKTMEQTLKRSAENLRLMVQGGIRPMMVIDRDGLVEAVSDTGAFLLGYKEKEMIGRNVDTLIVPLSRMEIALHLLDLHKNTPRPLITTLRVLRKDGSSLWIAVEVGLVVAGDGATEKYLVKFEKLDVASRPKN